MWGGGGERGEGGGSAEAPFETCDIRQSLRREKKNSSVIVYFICFCHKIHYDVYSLLNTYQIYHDLLQNIKVTKFTGTRLRIE